MQHYLLVKLNDKITIDTYCNEVTVYFKKMCQEIKGYESFEVIKNKVQRPNNMDVMIIMNMSEEGLNSYVDHPLHHKLKDKFDSYISKKVVFDK